MCISEEKVQQIISVSENRLEQKMRDNLYKQQVQLSQTVSNNLGEIKRDISDSKSDHKILTHAMKDMHEKIDKILEQLPEVNRRISLLELWRAALEGASSFAKVMWGVMGVFLIASCFALFKMYVEFQNLDVKIQNAVSGQLSTYEFNITE